MPKDKVYLDISKMGLYYTCPVSGVEYDAVNEEAIYRLAEAKHPLPEGYLDLKNDKFHRVLDARQKLINEEIKKILDEVSLFSVRHEHGHIYSEMTADSDSYYWVIKCRSCRQTHGGSLEVSSVYL